LVSSTTAPSVGGATMRVESGGRDSPNSSLRNTCSAAGVFMRTVNTSPRSVISDGVVNSRACSA
jgi:hypothetical protein